MFAYDGFTVVLGVAVGWGVECVLLGFRLCYGFVG